MTVYQNIFQGRVRLQIGMLAAFAFFFSIVGSTGYVSAQANSAAANTNQAAAVPTAEATPIPGSAIVSEAEIVASRIRAMRSILDQKSNVQQEISDEIPAVQRQVEQNEPETLRILSETPALDEIRSLESDWRELAGKIAKWEGTLKPRIATLDASLEELNRFMQSWRLTLSAVSVPETETTDTVVPPEVLQKVNETIASIAEARRLIQERRTELLAVQTRVSELESRIDIVRDEINLARERTLNELLVREAPPIWVPQTQMSSISDFGRQISASFSSQWGELQAYAAERSERFALHGLVFVLLAAGLFWARSRIRPFVENEPKLEKAAQIFALPVATALILSVTLSSWFYPQAPRMLSSLIGAAALVPVVLLLRRMVDRPLFTILNALVVLYFIDRLREILSSQPFTARIVFLAEMLGAILFLIWFLRSRSLMSGVEAAHYRIFSSIRKLIPFALGIFVIALGAGILGFVSLANVVGNGVLGSAYAALVIYTAVQIIRGLIIFALRVPPLSSTRVVRNNRPIIRDRSIRIVRWLAVIIWALLTLNLFSIRQTVVFALRDLFEWSATVGSISFSIGSILLFALMIWIAVLISRFLRFILEEDVYPRVGLAGGVSYAVSTMLHYSILVVGFVIAVGVLGVDFTKFAIIAGAIGIGIGFGLQNIINNFVSGIILLFERPVKVGDLIKLDQHSGTLTQIGLRASVVLTAEGSNVVVPNSQFISEAVTNWTMSNRERRIDIPVGVAYGTDPVLVIDLLTGVVTGREGILTEPPPKALFVGLGDNSLDFELRAWTDNADGWVGLRSEIMTGIYAALTEAGIEIPFPQQDLHLRTMDGNVAEGLARSKP